MSLPMSLSLIKMKNAQELVQEYLKQDQQKQKTWYKCKVCEMKIKVGDQVLLLLPGQSKEV